MAAREAANYAQLRPLADVLGGLRQAWTVEADALERVGKLEARAEILRRVVEVRASLDPPLRALRDAADQALDAADATAARVDQLTVAVAQDVDRLRDGLLAEWDRQRPAAHRAADTIAAGTGRFGQRRGAVHAAHDTLAGWAATWQPYLPDLPTDPDQLARRARSWDNRIALWTAFDQHAQHHATYLHPEYADAVTAVTDARTVSQQAQTAYRDAIRQVEQQLRPFRKLVHIHDPAAGLAATEQILTDAHAQRDAARDHLPPPGTGPHARCSACWSARPRTRAVATRPHRRTTRTDPSVRGRRRALTAPRQSRGAGHRLRAAR